MGKSINLNYFICKMGFNDIYPQQEVSERIKVNGEYEIALQIWKHNTPKKCYYLLPFGEWSSWAIQSLISLLISRCGESKLHMETHIFSVMQGYS